MQSSRNILSVVFLVLLTACAGASHPPKTALAARAAITRSPELQALIDRTLDPGDALLIGSGDIAACTSQFVHAQETAALVDLFPSATVFTAGDDAYKNGTAAQFDNCYGGSWGAFKERTRPAPGNHEYGIYMFPKRNNATPYFDYFGSSAGPAGLGYYSYDLGSWHIVSLNSMAGQKGAPSMDAQRKWLEDDLGRNRKPCILAYWHHPRFSSGEHGNDPSVTPLWNVLLEHHADVILNGHDHHYEWFDLQDADANPTSSGIREIIVGTGGGEERKIETVKKNSRKQVAGVYGVLLMTLHANSYEWHFIQADGTVPDRSPGVTECHE
ncbi:MAG: metallophosphoesterase [Acidobacteriota bacterium]